MSVIDVDRRIAAWLRAEAPAREPDHLLAAVLARTERTRRRPGWLIPERWRSVSTIETQVVPAPRIPWRVLGAVALIVLALAVGALMGSTAPTRTLPAPFGPALNGLVAYESDGDIFTADLAAGDTRAIVSGPDRDSEPVWSRDGTRLAFVRRAGDGARLYVASADGSGVRSITADWQVSISSHRFSPDGREVMFVAGVGFSARIGISAADGSGTRFLDLGMPAIEPDYRPPDGGQIAFIGTVGRNAHGLFVVNTDGTGLRTIVEPSRRRAVGGLQWSPDGTRLAYGLGEFSHDHGMDRMVETHVVQADGSGDRVLAAPGDAVWGGAPVWSNDGTRLAMVRGYSLADGTDAAIAIVPADGSVSGVETPRDVSARWYEWAPDDSWLLVVLDDPAMPSRVHLVNPDSGVVREALWYATSRPSWQRVAP